MSGPRRAASAVLILPPVSKFAGLHARVRYVMDFGAGEEGARAAQTAHAQMVKGKLSAAKTRQRGAPYVRVAEYVACSAHFGASGSRAPPVTHMHVWSSFIGAIHRHASGGGERVAAARGAGLLRF